MKGNRIVAVGIVVAAFLFALTKMPAEASAPILDPKAVPAE